MGRFGLGGVVGEEAAFAVGDGDGRHAVGHHVDLLRELGVLGKDLAEEVVDRAGDAVAVGLASDHHVVRADQGLEERGVLLREGLAVPAREDLRTKDRVVLGERIATLDLAPGLRAAQVVVEHAGLLDDAHEGVAVAAEDAVRRPDDEGVLVGALELLAVVLHLADEPGVVAAAEPAGHGRVRPHLALQHHLGRDLGEGGGVLVLLVQPEGGREDLVGEVRVEGGGDVGDDVGVLVDELGGARAVIDRARAAPATHVERAAGVTEVLLHVDHEEVHPRLVRARGLDVELVAVACGLVEEALAARRVVPLAGVCRAVERGEGKVLGLHGVLFLPRILEALLRSGYDQFHNFVG